MTVQLSRSERRLQTKKDVVQYPTLALLEQPEQNQSKQRLVRLCTFTEEKMPRTRPASFHIHPYKDPSNEKQEETWRGGAGHAEPLQWGRSQEHRDKVTLESKFTPCNWLASAPDCIPELSDALMASGPRKIVTDSRNKNTTSQQ